MPGIKPYAPGYISGCPPAAAIVAALAFAAKRQMLAACRICLKAGPQLFLKCFLAVLRPGEGYSRQWPTMVTRGSPTRWCLPLDAEGHRGEPAAVAAPRQTGPAGCGGRPGDCLLAMPTETFQMYPPLSNDRPRSDRNFFFHILVKKNLLACLTTNPRSDRTFWSNPWSDRDFGGR